MKLTVNQPQVEISSPFSTPLLTGAKTLLGARRQGQLVNWSVYLDIYTRTSVGICFLALFVLAMALVISSRQEENRITIFSSLSVAFRMILNLDFQLEIRTYYALKMIILSGSMLGYLLLALYQSDLTSKMTVSPPQLPIRCGNIERNMIKNHSLHECTSFPPKQLMVFSLC